MPLKRSSLTVGVDVPWVTSWTAEPIQVVPPFPARWTILPLMMEASAPAPAGHALMPGMAAPASVAVVTFLQLCGVSDDIDRAWRTRREAA